jgi:hypothetical protein
MDRGQAARVAIHIKPSADGRQHKVWATQS